MKKDIQPLFFFVEIWEQCHLSLVILFQRSMADVGSHTPLSDPTQLSPDQKKQAREVFDKYDADKSGTVEKKELEKMLKELRVFENASLADVYSDMVFKVPSKWGNLTV